MKKKLEAPEFNPETHVLIRRMGKLIAVDKQIVRWRKRKKKHGFDTIPEPPAQMKKFFE